MRRFIKTIPDPLTILAVVTIIGLFVKILVLNKIPEPVPGLWQLGVVAEGVMGSVLASFAFYLVIVHYKETRDRSVIYPLIIKRADMVVVDCKSQLSDMSKAASVNVSLESLSKQDIDVIVGKMKFGDTAPLFFYSHGAKATWNQYFHYHRRRSVDRISMIISSSTYLDVDLVSRLSKIQDSDFFSFLHTTQNLPLNDVEISGCSKMYYEYCILVRELDIYLKRMDRLYKSEVV